MYQPYSIVTLVCMFFRFIKQVQVSNIYHLGRMIDSEQRNLKYKNSVI